MGTYRDLVAPPDPLRSILRALSVVSCAALLVAVIAQRQILWSQIALWAQPAPQPAQPVRNAHRQVAVKPEILAREKAIVLAQKAPWRELFHVIEVASAKDVALLELHPSIASASFELVGEARNAKAMLTYVDRLNAQPDVELAQLSYQQTTEQDKVESIFFKLRVRLSVGRK